MNKNLVLGARLLLGAIFVLFGLNGFFRFLPMPEMPAGAMTYLMGLMSAGYFFPVLKVTEILCGVALLSGFYVPLALTVLAPIILQIILFHLFLAPAGIMIPGVILALELFLAYSFRSAFEGILRAK